MADSLEILKAKLEVKNAEIALKEKQNVLDGLSRASDVFDLENQIKNAEKLSK